MNAHRRFFFDDPADSYWNTTLPSSNPAGLSSTESGNNNNNNGSNEKSQQKPVKKGASESSLFLVVETPVTPASFFDDDEEEDENNKFGDDEEDEEGFEAVDQDRDPSLSIGATSNEGSEESKNGAAVAPEKQPTPKPIAAGKSMAQKALMRAHTSLSSMHSDSSLGSCPTQFADSGGSATTLHLDFARLKSEHRKLKKYFEATRDERYKSPPVEEVVERLAECRPTSLELFRSRRDKEQLLRAALARPNWDITVTVLLFLRRTLTSGIFRELLLDHPTAADIYVSYLREAGDDDELSTTLFALGRCDESARAELAAIERLPPGGRAQLDALKRCLAGGLFGGSPFTAAEERLVHEHVLAAEKKAASNGGKWGGATSTGFINK